MDWLKLFALLVAVASVHITADGPKKKIRIHLPQKVKHIHHHKKIYITNHPAPSQYAPAFMPGVKGGLALPSNVPRPTAAGILPLNSVELYDNVHPARLPPISPAASKLLPLYRARGRYGPDHSDWDEQDYDVESPRDHKEVYSPSGYSAPPQSTAAASVSKPPKRVKYVKVNELPRKKIIRKKPKRVIVRPKPQHQTASPSITEEEHPVSTFHEQFYSDLEEAGTISKIKKPPRIEKIIDGDTEHIHTYSEEHIHKVVFDDDSKVTGVVGVDPIGSMSALSASHPLIPLKNSQALIAVPTSNFRDIAVVGSMGTPSHLEYAAYNPHDVTHDHVFHDHGEIPSNVEVTKETLRLPPKMSYNSRGLPISQPKRTPNKHRLYAKPTKPTHDFSYYENLYNTPGLIPKKPHKQIFPTNYGISSEGNINDFRPVPSFRFKEGKKKSKNRPYGKQITPGLQASVPSPFAISSTIVHEYEPKNYGPGPTGFTKFRDSLMEFKETFGDLDYDNYAASSNVHTSEEKNDSEVTYQPKDKKSVSTQNIHFGGQDHQTFVDHIGTSATGDEAPTALENVHTAFEESTDPISPTPYTIKETSPAHPYYTAMALKALHGNHAEASNNNEQYVEPPETTAAAATEPTVYNATTSQPLVHYYNIQSTDAITPDPEFVQKQNKRRREKQKGQQRQRYILAEFRDEANTMARHTMRHHGNKRDYSTDTSGRGNLKYGDKI